MPTVSEVIVVDGSIQIKIGGSVRTFTEADLNPNLDTPAEVENAANSWAAANIPQAQIRIHVFSMGPPIRWVVRMWDLGLPIDPNWWVRWQP